jgi:hypothetical protein
LCNIIINKWLIILKFVKSASKLFTYNKGRK